MLYLTHSKNDFQSRCGKRALAIYNRSRQWSSPPCLFFSFIIFLKLLWCTPFLVSATFFYFVNWTEGTIMIFHGIYLHIKTFPVKIYTHIKMHTAALTHISLVLPPACLTTSHNPCLLLPCIIIMHQWWMVFFCFTRRCIVIIYN